MERWTEAKSHRALTIRSMESLMELSLWHKEFSVSVPILLVFRKNKNLINNILLWPKISQSFFSLKTYFHVEIPGCVFKFSPYDVDQWGLSWLCHENLLGPFCSLGTKHHVKDEKHNNFPHCGYWIFFFISNGNYATDWNEFETMKTMLKMHYVNLL